MTQTFLIIMVVMAIPPFALIPRLPPTIRWFVIRHAVVIDIFIIMPLMLQSGTGLAMLHNTAVSIGLLIGTVSYGAIYKYTYRTILEYTPPETKALILVRARGQTVHTLVYKTKADAKASFFKCKFYDGDVRRMPEEHRERIRRHLWT
jgi:hypothetical protein